MSQEMNDNDKKEVAENKAEAVTEKKVEKKEKEKKSIQREIMEWVVCIVVAFSLALIIKFFVFTPTLVMQESMTPTILNGERVLINRLVRTFGWDLNRGDIITFEAPSSSEMANGRLKAIYYDVENPIDSFFYNVMEIGKVSYIKRVVGLPGDRIEIRGGEVFVNGKQLEETYLEDTQKTYIPEHGVPSEFVVPEGYIFAVGDNRMGSSDCRAFGCVPLEKVEGRVSFRIWPLNKLGGID